MHPIYYTITDYHTHELVIERSRFITHLFATERVDEAITAIKMIEKKHYTASHNCTAYILGRPPTIQKSNDNGEPKGTAGVPMAQALANRHMTNITAVVTRYFGGTKLGAGGLIRAYSSAITSALDTAPIMTFATFHRASLLLSYDEINQLYYAQELNKAFTIESLSYADDVTATIEYVAEYHEVIEHQFTQLLFRPIRLQMTETVTRTIPYQNTQRK